MNPLGVFLFTLRPPEWDASLSQGYPLALNTLVIKALREQSILPSNTKQGPWPELERGPRLSCMHESADDLLRK